METHALGCEWLLVPDFSCDPVALVIILLTCATVWVIVSHKNALGEDKQIDEANHSNRQGSCSNLEEGNR